LNLRSTYSDFCGDEKYQANCFEYAWDLVVAAQKSKAQDMGLFFDRNFDCDQKDEIPTRRSRALLMAEAENASAIRVEKSNEKLLARVASGS